MKYKYVMKFIFCFMILLFSQIVNAKVFVVKWIGLGAEVSISKK